MKSKRAQAYIINRSTHMNCMGMTVVGLTTVEAKEACQIVEQEMREKAVEAFRQLCPLHDGRCLPDCGDCHRMKQFIQKLNED